jgi:hypothetical protein
VLTSAVLLSNALSLCLNKVINAIKQTYNTEAKNSYELNLEMLKVHALAGVGSIPASLLLHDYFSITKFKNVVTTSKVYIQNAS